MKIIAIPNPADPNLIRRAWQSRKGCRSRLSISAGKVVDAPIRNPQRRNVALASRFRCTRKTIAEIFRSKTGANHKMYLPLKALHARTEARCGAGIVKA
jgi:hypothetical protein